MTRIVYVNGRYVPYRDAAVHVEDRGFQFADSIYEVCEVQAGAMIDEKRHMARLARSLAELGIEQPMAPRALARVMRETIRRNRVVDGLVYLQVTRGEAPRDFPFPAPNTPPTVVCLARRLDQSKIAARAAQGVGVVTMPDIRWARCDIKTTMLLPAVLAKETARGKGAYEAWLVDESQFLTEGASSNAWIVDATGVLVTHAADRAILPGVTRATVIDLAAREGVRFVERRIAVAELATAREAFMTSASGTVMPVVEVDGVKIADGKPGRLTQTLRSKFHQAAETSRF